MTDHTFTTTVAVAGGNVTISAPTPAELDRAVAEARRHWTDAHTDAPPPPTTQQQQSPTCAHGPMVHKHGESKTSGQPWSGWFCPLPRERKQEQCAPRWDGS